MGSLSTTFNYLTHPSPSLGASVKPQEDLIRVRFITHFSVVINQSSVWKWSVRSHEKDNRYGVVTRRKRATSFQQWLRQINRIGHQGRTHVMPAALLRTTDRSRRAQVQRRQVSTMLTKRSQMQRYLSYRESKVISMVIFLSFQTISGS